MDEHNTPLDEFRQLNLFIQFIVIGGIIALVVLLILNPAAGVSVTSVLIAIKGLFMGKRLPPAKGE